MVKKQVLKTGGKYPKILITIHNLYGWYKSIGMVLFRFCYCVFKISEKKSIRSNEGLFCIVDWGDGAHSGEEGTSVENTGNICSQETKRDESSAQTVLSFCPFAQCSTATCGMVIPTFSLPSVKPPKHPRCQVQRCVF